MSQELQPTEFERRVVAIGKRIAGTRFGAWLILNGFTPLDRWLLKRSRGRLSLTGRVVPTLLLTTIGAKSGQPRTVPLVFLRDEKRLVLIASNGGQLKHPAWYHNLRKNPAVLAAYDGRELRYLAREVSGAERERLWQQAVAFYAGYHSYSQRVAREIPVIVLDPAPVPAAMAPANAE